MGAEVWKLWERWDRMFRQLWPMMFQLGGVWWLPLLTWQFFVTFWGGRIVTSNWGIKMSLWITWYSCFRQSLPIFVAQTSEVVQVYRVALTGHGGVVVNAICKIVPYLKAQRVIMKTNERLKQTSDAVCFFWCCTCWLWFSNGCFRK